MPRQNRHIARLLLLRILPLLIVAGCASQRPPEGGPKDTDPPFIEDTDPPTGTVRFTGQEVTLSFNEYVERRSFQEAVHISPLPSTPPLYEWSGKDVTIVFQDTLQRDRTYVISIGTKVRDTNAGNPMATNFQVAFSTGDSLDNGRFDGVVLDEKPAEVTLIAYLLNEERADTLNPSEDRPDYAVMSAEDGKFQFSYVAPGCYRVFAIRDKNNNMLYDVETDAIGIPMRDIMVEDSLPSEKPLRFRLFTADTTRPTVQRIEALFDQRVRVKFNETVYPQPLPIPQISVQDSATGHLLPVIAALDPPGERYSWDLYLAEPMADTLYLFKADSIIDGARNLLKLPPDGIVFRGVTEQDTLRPKITGRFPDPHARNVPPDSSFVLIFDRPVAEAVHVSLSDSAGNPVALEAEWLYPARVHFRHPVLMKEASYELCVDLRTVRDSLSSRTAGDSVFCLSFTTGEADRYGTIAGSVRSEDSTGQFRIRLRQTGKKDGIHRETAADEERTYRFPQLPEGSYVLDAYEDANGDRRYNPGTAYPFTPPEPFGVLRDTIRVRARWETNGVIIPVR